MITKKAKACLIKQFKRKQESSTLSSPTKTANRNRKKDNPLGKEKLPQDIVDIEVSPTTVLNQIYFS